MYIYNTVCEKLNFHKHNSETFGEILIMKR